MIKLKDKTLSSLYRQGLSALNHWLLPQRCFLCADLCTQPICHACLADLPYQDISCYRCGCALPQAGVCGDCLKQPPPYTHTQAMLAYTYPVDKLIQAAKFHSNLAILNLLGDSLARHVTFTKPPDVLIPVPLYISRLRDRGYNQSMELAKRVAKQTGIPLSYNACERHKKTLPQVTQKNAKERQKNVRGAFRIQQLQPQWQHIVLIDDVVTTGSTVKELSKVFFKSTSKISRIDVWCCARTLSKDEVK